MYNEKLRSQKRLIVSADGTDTLFSEEFAEPYHSTKDGALHESLEKHVKPALSIKKEFSSLTILDICFGLGYNTFSTLYYIKKHNLKVKIHILSPEFDRELIESLKDFNYPKEFEIIKDIIYEVSRNFYYKDEQFEIEILLGDARVKVPMIKEKIDIIYQDAFSPKKNPLLWTREFFGDIALISKKDVLLTTYSIASATRLGLYENGFYIFLYYGDKTRCSTVASLKKISNLEYIDMELKKVRNPTAKSLRDINFIKNN